MRACTRAQRAYVVPARDNRVEPSAVSKRVPTSRLMRLQHVGERSEVGVGPKPFSLKDAIRLESVRTLCEPRRRGWIESGIRSCPGIRHALVSLSEGTVSVEREKMLAGELYDPFDP